MFRDYRVILRELVINTLPSYTNISNAAVGNYQVLPTPITLLHVSTLSCHPQGACNQYLAKYTNISNAAVGNYQVLPTSAFEILV